MKPTSLIKICWCECHFLFWVVCNKVPHDHCFRICHEAVQETKERLKKKGTH